jgi:UDP-N-acetylenolpyruvoylglucosamine reductase
MSVPATKTVVMRGELRLDEPLARHTSWRVGGPARRLYRPVDREDLIAFLDGLRADEPLLIDRVQAEVARTNGIRLIPEVRRVGELS